MEILCLEFINTLWHTTHKPFEDPLDSVSWVDSFCEKWDFPRIDSSGHALAEMRELRAFLYSAMLELTSHADLSDAVLDRMTVYLQSVRVSTCLEKREGKLMMSIIPENFNSYWIIQRIATSFAHMVTSYPLERIKKCNNPECNWFFYDESKSKTRKWCENSCASLIKVRRFREKNKSQYRSTSG